MSKKETEFDRIDRMKKLEREAEVAKRKSIDAEADKPKKSGKPKTSGGAERNWTKNYDMMTEEEYDYV